MKDKTESPIDADEEAVGSTSDSALENATSVTTARTLGN
jgi:hypothetical protein